MTVMTQQLQMLMTTMTLKAGMTKLIGGCYHTLCCQTLACALEIRVPSRDTYGQQSTFDRMHGSKSDSSCVYVTRTANRRPLITWDAVSLDMRITCHLLSHAGADGTLTDHGMARRLAHHNRGLNNQSISCPQG